MANPPPPYDDITGISRTVMKDNAQETIANYNGNARPGEMVVNLLNNDVYIGNTDGSLALISTGGGGAHADPAGPVGSVQLNAGGNLFTGTANLTFINNTLNVGGTVTSTAVSTGLITSGNIIPSADNTYFLGNATNRWANVWIGPGTLYITDSNIASNATAELTVLNGVLQINGADQLQVGQLKFVNNTIESTTGNINIEIGLASSSAELIFRRNTQVGNSKSFTMTGSQVVSTLYQDGGSFPSAPVLDLTKQVHKLADSDFVLPDGVEGQICYFAMDPGGSAEDIYIQVNHLRISQNGGANTRVNAIWHPFPYGTGNQAATLSTAIFTDGAWNVTAGTLG